MNSKIFITLNLLDNSILLNEGVLNALDWPRQVQLLINNDEKMLVLRACTVEDRQAVVVPDEHVAPFEISERTLFRKIKRLLGWDDENPRMCYGEYLPAHQAIRFDLKQAQTVSLE
jgi:hypothetical protein